MKCIIGLGNPGKEYTNTRHNIGFMVIDQLLEELNVTKLESKFKAEFVKVNLANQSVLLVKPQTFMNLSGEAVLAITNYYKIKLEDILVISDDLDLNLGQLRFKARGSDGGQKGLRSIFSLLKSTEIQRLKIGIGHNVNIDSKNYVLSKFHGQDLDTIQQAIKLASEAVVAWLSHGIAFAANQYNKKIK